jgi:tetratricopeptide (TPR) repeat protein
MVLTNLASAQWLLGNLSKANTILDRATALFQRAGDPQNPTFTLALQLHARMAEQAGDLPRAEADCLQALWLLEVSGNTRNLAGGLATTGYLLLRQNKLQEAQANLERGLQLVKASGTEDAVAAGLMSNLAECYHMQGRSQEAGPLFERAIAIDRRLLSSDHPNLLGVMRQYAVYLRATKRKAEAKRVEAYVKTHSAENKRLNATVNVIDVRQLLLEQSAR